MDVMARFRTVAAAGLALAATSAPVALAQGSLFTAVPVELSNFVLVSAPILSLIHISEPTRPY